MQKGRFTDIMGAARASLVRHWRPSIGIGFALQVIAVVCGFAVINNFGLGIVGIALVTATDIVVLQLMTAVATFLLVADRAGEPPLDVGTVLARCREHAGTIAVTVASVLGAYCIGLIGLGIGLLIASFATAVTMPVRLLEEHTPWQAIRRSWRMINGAAGTTFLVLLTISVTYRVAWAVAGHLSDPAPTLETQLIVVGLVSSLVLPWAAFAMVHLYFARVPSVPGTPAPGAAPVQPSAPAAVVAPQSGGSVDQPAARTESVPPPGF